MSKNPLERLSRRERQIMSIVYRLGEANATQVLDQLPDPPSYSAVRAHLRILEGKGHLRHRADGPRYVYLPTLPRERARTPALEGLLQTLFEGSREKLVAALLHKPGSIQPAELDRLADLIEKARKEGR